uniref:Large ribosomal subunit protein uL13c n=1 Tax=Liagoropsis maxima TaxID=1653392 RepID=A0A1G4NWG7_9FLOR|nr:Ribosomal protein L13 [Liagoropsis maxima]SCW22839.1 Ribosomal protein L13 [Liagoropsis maxima]
MNTIHIPKPACDETHKWYLIDARGCTLGRLATKIAVILQGKNQTSFHPSYNCKNHVIIINTQEIAVTGRKKLQKLYYRHSGRPGHLKRETLGNLQERLPNRIIENAVRKMLPKSVLGRQIFKNLKVYRGNIHPHQAQQPIMIDI